MAPKTKEAVIAELKAKGIEFDEDAKYSSLCKLLKEANMRMPVENDVLTDLPIVEERTLTHSSVRFQLPDDLIKRARKIGFTDEQIASYADAKALEAACDRIKPQVTPQPPPKKRQIFKPFPEKPKGEPAQAVCTSQITTLRAAHVIRAGYDQSNMEMFCRQHNPKIFPESICNRKCQRITHT